ncbi:alpha/beta fold hydrolase [Streptomyces coeruleorubidus]|uniref:alpha/beta fold hydrolase n=1 Tax=Streptomyces coeruleorubidus TaxID=116188 RepID=UPI0033BDB31C
MTSLSANSSSPQQARDANTTFVLVHGSCSSSLMWAPDPARTALLGHRSFAVDRPGHGFDAQYPAAYQAPQDLEAWAAEPSTLVGVTLQDNVDIVVDIVRQAVEHGPVVLVGASLGGTTITGVGNTVPDLEPTRLHLRTEGVERAARRIAEEQQRMATLYAELGKAAERLKRAEDDLAATQTELSALD